MLRDVLDRVRHDRRTLTVFNHEGPDQVIDEIRRYMVVRNVEVVERRTEPPTPRGFVVLHDDGETVEAGSVSALHDYLDPDRWERAFDVDTDERPEAPAIYQETDDGIYTVSSASKLPLIRASHQIEHLATEGSGGRLLSGFQELSKLRDTRGTWEQYSKIASCGTEIHVFGSPDVELPAVDRLTVNGADNPEIRRTWFLAYLDDERSGVLIAEEMDEESTGEDGPLFEGFFSFRREIAEEVTDYLVETYLDGTVVT